jgi:hypothetical protein
MASSSLSSSSVRPRAVDEKKLGMERLEKAAGTYLGYMFRLFCKRTNSRGDRYPTPRRKEGSIIDEYFRKVQKVSQWQDYLMDDLFSKQVLESLTDEEEMRYFTHRNRLLIQQEEWTQEDQDLAIHMANMVFQRLKIAAGKFPAEQPRVELSEVDHTGRKWTTTTTPHPKMNNIKGHRHRNRTRGEAYSHPEREGWIKF